MGKMLTYNIASEGVLGYSPAFTIVRRAPDVGISERVLGLLRLEMLVGVIWASCEF
jgi:hypothetical protein